MLYNEFLEAKIAYFPLNKIIDGVCQCHDENCQNAGKHPRASGWQSSPQWSQDQADFMEESGQLDTGYGVVIKDGLLVVDVDARNGGVESFDQLHQDFPDLVTLAGLVVATGSGGGSKHLYYRMESAQALKQHLDAYPGIDFKSTGFVVGPGSMHASGNTYTVEHGSPFEIGPPPSGLVDLLKKPDTFRATLNGTPQDVSEDDIIEMLHATDPDCGYDQWIRTGMALHRATDGTGLELWDEWSRASDKYPGTPKLERHWHSFGKSANPVTLGTLAHYATEAGWSRPVTFSPDNMTSPHQDADQPVDLESIDILRPPGFVGELVDWINSQSRYPRERLAVAAALTVMSAVAGMRHQDEKGGLGPNIIAFGVAASSTGKESILQSAAELMDAAGVGSSVHGAFKSEQEIFRNLLEHQAATYLVDEMGEVLKKLVDSKGSGGASYLSGIIGQLMSIYSKSTKSVKVSGDLKRQIVDNAYREREALVKEHGENPVDRAAKDALRRANERVESAQNGINRPFLSIFGLTTPIVFDKLMTYEMAANGFLSRAMIFRELDDNPERKPRNKIAKSGVPDAIAMTLQQLYAPGYSERPKTVARHGEMQVVKQTEAALDLLDEVYRHFHDMASVHDESTGLTPIPRRGLELVLKVSFLIGIPGGVVTEEHVRWAWALVDRDIRDKIAMTYANSAPSEGDRLLTKIISKITKDHGETHGKIRSACRPDKKEDVDKGLALLVERGRVRFEEVPASRGAGRTTKKYFLT